MLKLSSNSFFRYLVPVMLVLMLVGISFSSTLASGYPSIAIASVDPGKSVTINGTNFPKGQTFTARMAKYGKYALDGVVAGTVETKESATFSATFTIPADLAGEESIAIRLDSAEGYYAFNWFYNMLEEAAEPVLPEASSYLGHPIFSVTDVERNLAVGIETDNLPAGQTFTVKMGKFLTRGIDGIEVGTLDTGEGGVLKSTFTIPKELADLPRIAIRMDSDDGYYAYNWFWNNSTGAAAAGDVAVEPVVEPVHTEIPKILVEAVVRDTNVTLAGSSFPAGETFKVMMRDYSAPGADRIDAGTYETGEGGDFSSTFTIPAELAGKYLIAIRLETESGVFYAYNWFFNNTTAAG